MVFQDPLSSLNPVFRVGYQIAEPFRRRLEIGKREAWGKALELLKRVGIPDAETRIGDYPHQFSGGQRQRIMIAMAIALKPRLLIADEPTTALDVTIQAQILDLLRELQAKVGMALILITHDLGVVAEVADEVAVMYAGKVAEQGSVKEIFANPKHPYTEALLSAVPIPDPAIQKDRRRIMLGGEIPNPVNPPAGCRFHTRCPIVEPRCMEEEPLLEEKGADHRAACWLR